MTHWFGGLGIVVIFIALLPQVGRGTVHMFNAESTGPTSDRVLPRIKSTAMALFTLYVIFALAAIGVSVSTMGSCGPGFGMTGATCTYSGLPEFSKALTCVSMLLGRLEMFTLLAMLQPAFWRQKKGW